MFTSLININMKSKVTLKYKNYLFPSNHEAGQFMNIACLREEDERNY